MGHLQGMTVEENVILEGSENFPQWSVFCTHVFGEIRKFDMPAYIDTGVASSPSDEDATSSYDRIIDEVVRRTVSREILDRFAGTWGRTRLLGIQLLYHGLPYNVARILGIQFLIDMVTDKSLTLKEQIQRLKKADSRIWTDTLKIFALDYLCLDHPELNQVFTSIRSDREQDGNYTYPSWQDILDKVSEISNLSRVTRNPTAAGVGFAASSSSDKNPVKCFKCQGWGHVVNKCGSPVWYTEDGHVRPAPKSSGKSNRNTGSANIANQSDSPLGTAWFCAMLSSTSPPSLDKPGVYIDSGASHHLTPHREWLCDFVPFSGAISGLGLSSFTIAGKGNMKFRRPDGQELVIQNVYYIPDAAVTLLSVRSITRTTKKQILFSDTTAYMDGVPIGSFSSSHHNLYALSFQPLVVSKGAAFKVSLHDVIHGHSTLEARVQKEHPELNVTNDSSSVACTSCDLAKSTDRRPKTSTTDFRSTTRPLEVIHADLSTDHPVGLNGERHFLAVIDDYTHMGRVYPITSKANAANCLKHFIAEAENHFNHKGYKVSQLRTDNGGEFLSNWFHSYLVERGTHHSFTVPHLSHQNGHAERFIRTILDKARTFMVHGALPVPFWPYLVMFASVILNSLPSSAISNETPFTRWSGHPPQLNQLVPFGCKVIAHIPTTEQQSKFHSRSIEAVYLGRSVNLHASVVYDSNSKTFRECKLGKIHADEFPFRSSTAVPKASTVRSSGISGARFTAYLHNVALNFPPARGVKDTNAYTADPNSASNSVVSDGELESESQSIASNSDYQSLESDPEYNISDWDTRSLGVSEMHSDFEMLLSDNESRAPSVSGSSDQRGDDINCSENQESEGNLKRRRSNEDSNVPKDVYAKDIPSKEIPLTSQTKRILSNDGTDEPNKRLELSTSHTDYIDDEEVMNMTLSSEDDDMDDEDFTAFFAARPNTYKQAMLRPDSELWLDAMNSEIASLTANDTFELVDLPEGKKLIGSRWVYSIKDNMKYKARVVARGFTQEAGIDYQEIFSPVIRYESIKLLFSLAAKQNKVVHQLDINTAFLNAELPEETYIKQIDGFTDKDHPDKVLKLNRALYGLKQLPLMWNKEITEFLLKKGFQQLQSEKGLYFKGNVVLGLYVDDILFFANNNNEASEIKRMFESKYKIKDLGVAKKVLGINVKQEKGTIKLSLEDKIETMLEDFDMKDANAVATPCIQNQVFQPSKPCDSSDYRSIVGKLLFMANTVRYDIAFIVSKLSRYFNEPTEDHYNAAKRVLRYLQGTKDHGLVYFANNDDLKVYVDADWGSDPENRKSTTGYVIKYQGSPISWKSKKQQTVALLSTEAEYMAITEVVKEVLWLLQVFEELQISISKPVKIYEDNRSAMLLAEHPHVHQRTKHIDIRYHCIRDYIIRGLVELEHVDTNNQVADLLTKSLGKQKFRDFKSLATDVY